MANAVSLRKVTEGDSRLIVRWRNENRHAFPSQDELTLGSQYCWFWDTYLKDPVDHYYLVVVNDRPAGTISFNSRTREIGRVMLGNKALARQGIMSQALTEVMEAFSSDWYWLKVLKANEEAIAFYRKNGFTEFQNFYGEGGDGDWQCMERCMS